MDDDVPRDDSRQRTGASKVPAHQKKLLTIDSGDGEHATDSEPESVPSKFFSVKTLFLDTTVFFFSPSKPLTPSFFKKLFSAASGSSNNSMKYVSVKSPTQCLRLGLSRLARVKPLHPSATSS
ncbi:R51A1 protein, partial [Corythaeola cristata]|nr:R51A1 protein [Corythaeola cristata]